MSVAPGQSLLHYRLVEKIGAGGMGVVWKAVDTDLGREVAIKILPEPFARDAARLARFEREAKLLASLNHANIATVHGLHQHDRLRFLAMELVGGEDLADRIARGPLPPDEALRIARQVADGLEAAHERGVIHRDLKPANIRVTDDGTVKVLDFGLAKAFESEPASSDPSESPTMTSAGTMAGMILGTAAYMSSEQAQGRPVDKRADIWAFGCVLNEMLTARRTFAGETVSETLASVMKDEPDFDRLPADTPAPIRRLLRRCLVKDPRRRLRDIGEARLVIEEVAAGKTDEAPAVSALSTPARSFEWARLLPWGVAALLALLLVWTWLGRPTVSPTAGGSGNQRLSVALGPGELLSLTNHDYEIMTPIAVSPAGDSVVYVAEASGESMAGSGGTRVLRRRSLDRYETEVIRGTESAEMPFFSPDGRWIGFFDGDQLVKVPAAGGARVTIADTTGPGNGASWARDDMIVFAHSYAGPLWTVRAAGGEPRPLTTLADNEVSHRYPHLLPDGRSVLFTVKVRGILSFDDARIAIADLQTGEHRTVVEKGMYGMYVPSGHLVFARQTGLLAAPFDLRRLEISGGAVPVLDGVVANPITGAALFATAPDGTLVYVPGQRGSGLTTLSRVERKTGSRTVLDTEHSMSFPRLSPDETRLVLHGAAANDQVMVVDLERGNVLRVSDANSNNILPIWGFDGDRVVFTTLRSGSEEIVSMPAGGGPMQTLVEPFGAPQDGHSWSPDGKLLAFTRGVRNARDIWILDVDGGGEPVPFLDSAFYEGEPVFSPDGKWIAYTSDQSGTREIYASPYPGPGGKIQLSSGGGFFPRWRGDGGELYYQDEESLYAVPVRWTPAPRPGGPQPLFPINARNPLSFDVTTDGETFYIVEIDESFWIADRFNVVTSWLDELGRLTPDGG